jgi:hypothetical protein
MKASKFLILCCFVSFSLFVVACSGGGGSSDSGTVTMSVTDAKPLLPENVTNLFVEFSEVWVHKSGEGWIELDLVESPYTIDLLQFQDGNTTELVPPAILQSGKYTQVRIAVSNAMIRFDNGGTTDDRTVEIPSENLKTDKNFIVDVTEGSAVDIVIHFDLSMSVVVSGPAPDPSYKLKPVLHLFEDPLQAATIEGGIDNSSFDALEDKATIVVIAESNGEDYTRVEISQSTTTDPTEYSIFWIVPNQEYTVQIDINQDSIIDCEKTIGPGGDFDSPDSGEVIDIGTCS